MWWHKAKKKMADGPSRRHKWHQIWDPCPKFNWRSLKWHYIPTGAFSGSLLMSMLMYFNAFHCLSCGVALSIHKWGPKCHWEARSRLNRVTMGRDGRSIQSLSKAFHNLLKGLSLTMNDACEGQRSFVGPRSRVLEQDQDQEFKFSFNRVVTHRCSRYEMFNVDSSHGCPICCWCIKTPFICEVSCSMFASSQCNWLEMRTYTMEISQVCETPVKVGEHHSRNSSWMFSQSYKGPQLEH